MTALTTYKVAYKALRAASSGCHLRELLHPATQDWAQGLIQQLARVHYANQKEYLAHPFGLSGMSFTPLVMVPIAVL